MKSPTDFINSPYISFLLAGFSSEWSELMYPIIEDVEKADQLQLCRWLRFLESPGLSAIGQSDFYSVMDRETIILNRIMERSIEGGGFTPQISKSIGWER